MLRTLKTDLHTTTPATWDSVAVYYRVPQGVAVCCRVLQRVAECCRVLHAYTLIFTHLYTRAQTNTHKHMHTHIRTHQYTHRHAHTHLHKYTCMHAYNTCTNTNMCKQAYIPTYLSTYLHIVHTTCMHADIYESKYLHPPPTPSYSVGIRAWSSQGNWNYLPAQGH